ncbi:PorP/SprF family type IX secretion system membrane protein [Brumimicrobium aurantiacum]|nr:type IX secretion system membrane protein PorP/SprF [Brumimicrobium aurantiacum]
MLRKTISPLLALLTILVINAFNNKTYAQDPQFSQFYANPIYLNPAFAGSHGCPRFAVNYRNQWPALSGSYVTYSASYDQYIKGMNGGIGVIMTHDQQGKGTINHTTLSLIYNYHLKVNRKFTMMFAGKATWNQKSLDWDRLTFGDMIDPRRGFIYATGDVPRGGSRGFFDVSAGMVGFTEQFFFGVSAHHLNMPDESMIIGQSRMPIRFTGHAGAKIPLGSSSKYNNNVSIMPNMIFQYQQGFMETLLGTYVQYGALTAGAWFRSRDAFILSAGVNTGKFKVGYSYDVTVSALNNGVSGGSHEISLGLDLSCKVKKPSFRTISCPSF